MLCSATAAADFVVDNALKTLTIFVEQLILGVSRPTLVWDKNLIKSESLVI